MTSESVPGSEGIGKGKEGVGSSSEVAEVVWISSHSSLAGPTDAVGSGKERVGPCEEDCVMTSAYVGI